MVHHQTPTKSPLGLKSLLGTEFLKKEQIQMVVETAFALKERSERGEPLPQTLAGTTTALLFFEPSTRTRGSFEMAVHRMGGSTLVLTKEGSSSEKGETLIDTAKTVEAMRPHVLVLRHPSAGSPFLLDQGLRMPVINAGDGFHEHPTQALLDVMTIQEFKNRIEGLRVLIVGDIAHSRVARSNIYALKTLGAKVAVCGPPTLIPPKAEQLGVEVFHDLQKAVEGQDVVMALRIQFERLLQGQIPSRGEYARFYGVSKKIVDRCKPDVLVMHPGPINRGTEISPEVADGSRSVILNQVGNGVLLRMAVLHLLVGGEPLKPKRGFR